MLRVTLAQMRRSVPRLVAAGLAIAIGTAFVAATLLAGEIMSRTGQDAITARYGEADVVASGSISDADLAAVRALPTVAAADVLLPLGVELRTPAQDRWQTVLPAVSDERLTALRIASGRAPAASGEIALPQRAADALHVTLGGTLTAVYQEQAADGTFTDRTQTLTLVGIADDPHGAWTASGGAGIVDAADAATWNRVPSLSDIGPDDVVVAAAAGTSPGALRDDVAGVLPTVDVQTRDAAAARQLEQAGVGGDTTFVSVVLGFAAIALLVAALVIANTFQVLVAQRTRTLALLRAVGARRGQLRASVVTEAAILGLVSSAVGIVAGTALAQGMLSVLRRTSIEAPLPAAVHVTWQVVVVPLLVGVAVTVLSSLVPARAATRVTAIEALRPLDAPTAQSGAGRARLAVSVVLVVLGGLVLGGAVLLGLRPAPHNGLVPLALGVLGGAVSFVGVLLSAVFWVPPVVQLVQRVLRPLGPVPRLAAANTVRNPRRTAATSTALLIGVTLVVMMSTGAASARASLDHSLDRQYPVDVIVEPAESGGIPDTTLPDGLAADVAAIDGVAHVVTLRSAYVRLDRGDGGFSDLVVRALTPQDAATVMHDASVAHALADGAILVPDWWAPIPDTVKAMLLSNGTTSAATGVPLRTVLVPGLDAGLVTPTAMDRIAPDAPVDALFVSLTPQADATEVLRHVQDSLGSADFRSVGPGALRAQYDRIITILLAVVVGLLGVAVLIALLGVTNTLSLSVIERRRESATLRAIGLSRRALRGTLAIEGVLIAGVGAVIGSVFGLLYGWAGAATVLGQVGPLTLSVPWRDLAIVLVVALGAGLLASVLPARSAVRTPPVAALADE